ncbi:ABC transporter permease [Bifidobacterium sp. 82T10]|uniref:ABC transporter permease n=1 Tax=Bifidobacterium miconis TaxID=2834435 RepID=A0ABS6WHT3_9BIFI|nr:ABC transporter permease [Bifidobacterium miconis]MBW3093614.1 ABC transporter permease [Bifidobacterium miconis]
MTEPSSSSHDARPPRQIARVKARIAAREAWRSIVSGTSHTFAATLVLALGIAFLFGMDLAQTNRLINESRTYAQSGAATVTITLRHGIDGAACEGLAGVNGVQAAGALRQADRKITFATLPSTGIPTYETTPGAVGLFSPALADDGDGMGVILSSDVADALGAQAGRTMALKGSGQVRVRGVYEYPDDGRDSQYSYAVLEPVNSAQPFDVCMVRTWPVPDSIDTLVYLAANVTSKEQRPQVSQLNTRFGSTPPSANLFNERLTAFAPWVMLVVAFALGFVMIRVRRLEFASALHAGLPKGVLVLQVLLELFAAALLAMLLCSPLAAWVWLTCDPANAPELYDTLLRVPAVGFAGLLLGGFVAILLTRERQLFAYFKNR